MSGLSAIALLIRDLRPELTDQQNRWNGRRPNLRRRKGRRLYTRRHETLQGVAPYQLDMCFGRLKNFDFAELFKVYPGPQKRPAPQGTPAFVRRRKGRRLFGF